MEEKGNELINKYLTKNASIPNLTMIGRTYDTNIHRIRTNISGLIGQYKNTKKKLYALFEDKPKNLISRIKKLFSKRREYTNEEMKEAIEEMVREYIENIEMDISLLQDERKDLERVVQKLEKNLKEKRNELAQSYEDFKKIKKSYAEVVKKLKEKNYVPLEELTEAIKYKRAFVNVSETLRHTSYEYGSALIMYYNLAHKLIVNDNITYRLSTFRSFLKDRLEHIKSAIGYADLETTLRNLEKGIILANKMDEIEERLTDGQRKVMETLDTTTKLIKNKTLINEKRAKEASNKLSVEKLLEYDPTEEIQTYLNHDIENLEKENILELSSNNSLNFLEEMDEFNYPNKENVEETNEKMEE